MKGNDKDWLFLFLQKIAASLQDIWVASVGTLESMLLWSKPARSVFDSTYFYFKVGFGLVMLSIQ